MRVKHPGPKDPALGHPQSGLPWSFTHAAACWSNGVVEHCKITISKHQISGCQGLRWSAVGGFMERPGYDHLLFSDMLKGCHIRFRSELVKYFGMDPG
jgi:hypothetical protein